MGIIELMIVILLVVGVVLVIIHFSNKEKNRSDGIVSLAVPKMQAGSNNYKTSDIMNETKNCPYCGEEILAGARKCKHCGEWLDLEENSNSAQMATSSFDAPSIHPIEVMTRPSEQSFNQPIVINNTVTQRSNGIGTAGFILALFSAIFCWVPGVNWIIWFLGFLFSFIGLFKRPRGIAFAGFILSIIDVILIVLLLGALAGIISSIF